MTREKTRKCGGQLNRDVEDSTAMVQNWEKKKPNKQKTTTQIFITSMYVNALRIAVNCNNNYYQNLHHFKLQLILWIIMFFNFNYSHKFQQKQ